MRQAARPTVSIVVIADGPCDRLAQTLESFRGLEYEPFEVCVVHGPGNDGAKPLLDSYRDAIKFKHCPERNLSMSRNMGIELAAGELLAFISGDGVPEPEWLSAMSAPFVDPAVAACGGMIYGPTGYEPQYPFLSCDRLGRARRDNDAPVTDRNYPFSVEVPVVPNTNAVFRRRALQEIGGFDEEFEDYLDETDICCRLVDAGWLVAQRPDAPVHQNSRPDRRGNEHRMISPYTLIRNKVYFAMRHALPYWPMEQVLEDCMDFSRQRRREHDWDTYHGNVPGYALEAFDREAEAAWQRGLMRGLAPDRRHRDPSTLAITEDFREFGPLRPHGRRRVLVFLSQDYPPGSTAGVARHTHNLAHALAALGHTVHVLTRGTRRNTVELEHGVWVHRLLPRDPLPGLAGLAVPEEIGGLVSAYAHEVERIARFRRIDVVEAPSWEVEGLAVLLGRAVPVVVNVVETLATHLRTHPELTRDLPWMARYARPVLALERRVFAEADGVVAATPAVLRSVQDRYDNPVDPARVDYLPPIQAHGAQVPQVRPAGLDHAAERAGRVAVLFVGRLDIDSGIDVLLDAASVAVAASPDLDFWVAGDASPVLSGRLTAQAAFRRAAPAQVQAAVRFLGVVDDRELHWLLARCGVVAIPARLESDGRVAIEAMMFGKPVVASDVPDLAGLVTHGANGLLTPVGDGGALAAALVRLADDAGLREKLGAGGTSTYERRHHPRHLAKRHLQALSRHFRTSLLDHATMPASTGTVVLPGRQTGWSLAGFEPCGFVARSTTVWLKAWTTAAGGIMEVRLDGEILEEIDLYAANEAARTFVLTLPRPGMVQLYWCGRRNARSSGSELILVDIEAPEQPDDVPARAEGAYAFDVSTMDART